MISATKKMFLEMKKEHPDKILLYRMGDFYEVYDDDAKLCADTLGLSLTVRKGKGEELAMAGFPHQYLAPYLRKLLASGLKVAICERETP